MPLHEAHRVPFFDQPTAFNRAELVGGHPANVGQIGKQFGGTLNTAGQHYGVAIHYAYHCILNRHATRQRPECVRQAIALAGSSGADDHQMNIILIGQHLTHDLLDEIFICLLDNRGYYRAANRQPLQLLKHRAVYLVGSLGRNAKTGYDHVHMRRQSCITHTFYGAPHLREPPVQEIHAAQVMGDRVAVAPYADNADDENEVLMSWV